MKNLHTFDEFLNEAVSSKSDIITSFIVTYADDDETELLDIDAEIADILKMVKMTGKGSFVKKIQSQYRRADRKDIEDFFDSIK
jgi:hypothetical protein